MKRLHTASMIMIILFVFMPTGAQEIDYVSSTLWTMVNDVRIPDNDGDGVAYCAFPNGIASIDITDPQRPTIIDKLLLAGDGMRIDIQGTYAYVADYWGGLKVVDISQPENLLFTGEYLSLFTIAAVAVWGSYAYLIDGDFGLIIVDVSDPSLPSLVELYGLEEANDVCVFDTCAVIADGRDGLLILDVSDPTDPVLIGTYESSEFGHVCYFDGLLYATEGIGDFCVFDVADPANPVLMGSLGGFSSVSDICIEGNYAYVSYNTGIVNQGLQIVDISDGSNPYRICDFEMPDVYSSGVQVRDGRAYVSQSRGLRVLDVSDPSQPFIYGGLDVPGWSRGLFKVDDYVLVVSDTFPMNIVDISDIYNPDPCCTFYTPGYSMNIYAKDTCAFIAEWREGLTILDISEITNPSILGQYDTPGVAEDVFVQGNYAYLADLSEMLIFDVTDPSDPVLTGSFERRYNGVSDIVVDGNYAYLLDSFLLIVDISDPSSPEYVGGYYVGGSSFTGLAVQGNYAYVRSYASGLKIIDISDPSNPELAGSYHDDMGLGSVAVSGPVAFVTRRYSYNRSNVKMLDVSDPGNPGLLAEFDTPGQAADLFISDNRLFIADLFSLIIIEFTRTGTIEVLSGPKSFSLAPSYPNPFNSSTTIRYELPVESEVRLEIFDLLGRKIETLISGRQEAGSHSVNWKADDFSSGIYFYKIEADNHSDIRSCTLLK